MNRKPTVSISNDVNDILKKLSNAEGITKSKAVGLLINEDSFRSFNKQRYNMQRNNRLKRLAKRKNHITLVKKQCDVD